MCEDTKENAMKLIEQESDPLMRSAMMMRWRHNQTIDSMRDIDLEPTPAMRERSEQCKIVLANQRHMTEREALLQARVMLDRASDADKAELEQLRAENQAE